MIGGHRAFRNQLEAALEGVRRGDVVVARDAPARAAGRGSTRSPGHLAGDRLIQAAARAAEPPPRAWRARVPGQRAAPRGRREVRPGARVPTSCATSSSSSWRAPTVRTSVAVGGPGGRRRRARGERPQRAQDDSELTSSIHRLPHLDTHGGEGRTWPSDARCSGYAESTRRLTGSPPTHADVRGEMPEGTGVRSSEPPASRIVVRPARRVSALPKFRSLSSPRAAGV